MRTGILMLFIGLFSGVISLCLAIEQAFVYQIPTMNYIYAEVVLWLVSVVCIGGGAIANEMEAPRHEYHYEYYGAEIIVRSAHELTETERNEQARLEILKAHNKFNKCRLFYKGETDCKR